MIDDLGDEHPSEVYTAHLEEVNSAVRESSTRLIDRYNHPDVCVDLMSIATTLDKSLNSDVAMVREMHGLTYREGDYFKVHHDIIPGAKTRLFTTVTMLDCSDDLEGGDLIIDDGGPQVIQLSKGDTVVFNSGLFHEVTPVVRGERTVLVSWVHSKFD